MLKVHAEGFSSVQLEVLKYICSGRYSVGSENGPCNPDIILWCAENKPGKYVPFDAECPVIIARKTENLAVDTGALPSVSIPFEGAKLLEALGSIAEQGVADDCQPSGSRECTDCLLGETEVMRHVRKMIGLFARSSATVLIVGESGTGKELAARAIHGNSCRKNGPFGAINCGALSKDIIDSELFGTVRGAYTGANDRPGLFEYASGGTLFLDEVGEMGGTAQTRFLRVLEQRTFSRLGETRIRKTDARIIAATNADLRQSVDRADFRLDLYHRLSILFLEIPPLRERKEDIPLLAYSFMDSASRIGITGEAMGKMVGHDWPGNVRELRNVISRAEILAEGGDIDERHVMFL